MRRVVAGLVLLLAGCASNMTDEAALTMAQTREATVRTSTRLAELAEKLPRTLEETNTGVARITSATSLAIVEVAHLSASMERTTTSLARLLDEARDDARETREERRRILGDVSAITSSMNALLARLEQSSRSWQDRAGELADQEARAAKAIAQITEASARMSESAARLSSRVEPDLTSASRSVATILADVAKVTERYSGEPPVTNRWELVVGAVGGVAVMVVIFGMRIIFSRAVEKAVQKRMEQQ